MLYLVFLKLQVFLKMYSPSFHASPGQYSVGLKLTADRKITCIMFNYYMLILKDTVRVIFIYPLYPFGLSKIIKKYLILYIILFYHNFIIYYYKYTVLINISCFALSFYYKTYLQKNIILFLL